MTIAFLLHEYPSRTETFLAREISALRALGFEVRIFALEAGVGATALPVGASAIDKVARRVRGAAWYHECGRDWARREQNHALKDVQHIHAGWATFPAEIAQGAANHLGVGWSFSGHARDIWVDGRDWEAKLESCDFALCCTRQGARHLQSLVPQFAPKVRYAPHGLPLEDWPFEVPDPIDGTLKCLSVGRLVPKKGFDVWLETLAKWRDEDEADFFAVIVGEGPERANLQARIETLQLQERVLLAGALSGDEVRAAMREADVLVLPSRVASDGDRDGLPNVLLEAGACGLPIVATTAGSTTDFCDHSIAQLCEPASSAALLEAIREWTRDASENWGIIQKRSQMARERVESLFDAGFNVQVLADGLQNAIESRTKKENDE